MIDVKYSDCLNLRSHKMPCVQNYPGLHWSLLVCSSAGDNDGTWRRRVRGTARTEEVPLVTTRRDAHCFTFFLCSYDISSPISRQRVDLAHARQRLPPTSDTHL